MDASSTRPKLHRRSLLRIAAATLIGGGVAAVYAFAAPKWYEAQISVVPGAPPRGTSSLGLLGAALPLDLPIDVGLAGSDADRIQAVLRSRSVTDSVIGKFDLQARYHVSVIEDARRLLWQHCSSRLEKKAAVVTVTCEDTDPHVAQAMTEYFGEYGNSVFHRISNSSAAEERQFLEKRVVEAKRDADDAAERLRKFEEEHKLVDLSEQSKAVVSAMASLKGELLSKELELSYLNGFSASDEATATQLRRQVAIMENKMKSLESDLQQETTTDNRKVRSRGKEDDLFPPAMEVPKLRFELAQLYRDQKLQDTLFLMLTQRYETAKINEARDTSAFQVLDHAALPTHKSRPHRARLIVLGLLLGFALSVGGTVYGARLRSGASSLWSNT